MKKNDLNILFAAALLPFVASAAVAAQEAAVPAEQIPAEAAAPAESVPAPAPENAAPADGEDSPEKAAAENRKREAEAVALLRLEKSRIDAEIALAQARLRRDMAPGNEIRLRREAANELRRARLAAEFAEIDEAKRTLDAVAARDAARDNLAMLARNSQVKEQELDARIGRLSREIELGMLNLQLTRSGLEEKARDVPAIEPVRLKDPFVEGTLYVSDRRIDFSGPVTNESARYIAERIYFYDNRDSEYPIFLVIDNSPGGSAFAGYQILKAMESSKAPVYVVVKGMAASMAAIITTLAERSFCYENSIILHHQASSSVAGNMTVMGEQLKQTRDWVARLFEPVCKKIGKTQEEFVADMYSHFSTGDWAAWGKEAAEMRWVDHVAERIVETAVPAVADAGAESAPAGTRFELPRLEPGDAWLIYDPQNRYGLAR
ncbi:MAG: ATP-dependent Clp protease proteolytic subunit [Candidatus Spyradosoma sp.]